MDAGLSTKDAQRLSSMEQRIQQLERAPKAVSGDTAARNLQAQVDSLLAWKVSQEKQTVDLKLLVEELKATIAAQAAQTLLDKQ
jgi:hypothetical protein